MDPQQRAELDIHLAAAGTDPDLVAAAVATIPDGSSPQRANSRTARNLGFLIGLGIAVAIIVWRMS